MSAPPTPQDLNQLLQRALGWARPDRDGRDPGRTRRWSTRIALTIVALILVFGTVYQVDAEEVGIVLRFGKVVRQTDPGLQMKLPLLERVRKVPIQRQLKEEFGFRTVEGGQGAARYRTVPPEALMLTGDLNVVHAEWVVQYRVIDPIAYLFNVRNPTGTLRALSESVMRETVGDRTVTEVLTVGRKEIEDRTMEQLNGVVNQYEMGLRVVQVIMQDATPPVPVRPAWDSVSGAQQQRERMINQAWADYNRDVPRAQGEAEEIRLRAQGYALDRVNRAQGEVVRFLALLAEYRRAPDVVRTRLTLEAQEQIYGSVIGKIYVDQDLQGILPLLQIDGSNVPGSRPATGAGPGGDSR